MIKKKLNRPVFFVFEGIDGSGKSTQVEKAFAFIQSSGIPSVKLREPADSRWGREIRERLSGKNDFPVQEQLELFLLDREFDTDTNIRPALHDEKVIVMDRYYFSNAAYQGAMGLSWQSIIDENHNRNFPEPDRIYLIDITPEIAIERIIARNPGGAPDQFEKKSFLKKVRDTYLAMTDERFCIIDGSDSVETVSQKIKNDMMNFIQKISL